jgi:hypothetical protein
MKHHWNKQLFEVADEFPSPIEEYITDQSWLQFFLNG